MADGADRPCPATPDIVEFLGGETVPARVLSVQFGTRDRGRMGAGAR